MKVAVVGVGYVGLVVAACLAEGGNHVVCVDTDEAKVQGLKNGVIPIYEPGLTEIVQHNIKLKRLTFTTDLDSGVDHGLIVFLAVGTPSASDGSADISAVRTVAAEIADCMTDYRIIVTKSTVPIGTCQVVSDIIRSRTEVPFDYVSNPEFLKEGAAVEDFTSPDRIIVGTDNPAVREIMKQLYGPFMRRNNRIIFMDPASAEMSKYAANTMLATRISLMNQLASICSAYGADIADVREGIASDYRIGSTFLFPGLGFGGLGLPNDLATCIKLARDKGLDSDLIEAVQNVNEQRRVQFLKRILDFYGAEIAGKRIAMWGASFKARTDDLRGAPSLHIIDGLLQAGAEVVVYDPVALPKLIKCYGSRIETTTKYYEALKDADGLVIVTEWNEFRRPDYKRMGTLMRGKVIFDGRNLYTPRVIKENGFRYFSIGRPSV